MKKEKSPGVVPAAPWYWYDFGPLRPDVFALGDSLDVLHDVEGDSVDMVLTDPPYFIKKADWDTFDGQEEYIRFMGAAFWQAERILKANGTLAFWHNDPLQMARLMEWIERNTTLVFNSMVVWVKPLHRRGLWQNPGEKNTLRKWFNICEFLLIYIKAEGGTDWNRTGLALEKLDTERFLPLRDYFRRAQAFTGCRRKDIIAACGQAADHCFRWNSSQWLLPTRATYLDIVATYGLDKWEGFRTFDSLVAEQAQLVQEYAEQIRAREAQRFVHNLDPLHCNVWQSNAKPAERIHPTQKPVDLLARAIRTHTKPGGIVCDFFAGSGSTGVAAKETGRRYILIEKEEKYRAAGIEWIRQTEPK